VKIQQTADSFEDFKSILSKEKTDYRDFTIYDFFFHLDRALKPKKQTKK
jgi:hypothetical protein